MLHFHNIVPISQLREVCHTHILAVVIGVQGALPPKLTCANGVMFKATFAFLP